MSRHDPDRNILLIDDIGLAAPASRALQSAGIRQLEQMTKWSQGDLATLHGMGPMALKTIREALATQGLSLLDD